MDLFYRLNVFPLTMPPLRDRTEDIPLLVRHLVQEFAKQMGKQIDAIPAESMEVLSKYSWPGNVRELRDIVERFVILTSGKRLRVPKDELIEQLQSPKGRGEMARLVEASDGSLGWPARRARDASAASKPRWPASASL